MLPWPVNKKNGEISRSTIQELNLHSLKIFNQIQLSDHKSKKKSVRIYTLSIAENILTLTI